MPHFKRNTGWTFLLATAIALLGLGNVQARSITKQNMVDLMTHSESILVGTVQKKSDGFHMGLPYTEITIKVAQNIKGNNGETYTFRQFGLMEPRNMGDGRINLMVTPAGWPTYAQGEQVMLFLHAPASETGFQTTAGLNQGKFTIRGNQIANELLNDNLFDRVAIKAAMTRAQQDLVGQQSGSYQAHAFMQLVRTAVEENWIENGVMTHED
ncbi:MAG TPA: hypothetical protein VFG52_09050 [Xanthomonadales bacterium]|nr:hypothetical protein [Xanthomonadales bacterium]